MKGHTQEGLPFQGSTPISAHHSAEGAKAAAPLRAFKTRLYVDLIEKAGQHGLSDHEAAKALGVPISSVNSIRNGLWPLVVPAERRVESPYNGPGRRTIWNTCWRIASEAEQRQLREEQAKQDEVPF